MLLLVLLPLLVGTIGDPLSLASAVLRPSFSCDPSRYLRCLQPVQCLLANALQHLVTHLLVDKCRLHRLSFLCRLSFLLRLSFLPPEQRPHGVVAFQRKEDEPHAVATISPANQLQGGEALHTGRELGVAQSRG